MFFDFLPDRMNTNNPIPNEDNVRLAWKLIAHKMKPEDENNYGGKVILPEFILEMLTFSGTNLPWTFRISPDKDHKLRTHVGVVDFTAPFGKIFLPEWLFTQLGLKNAERIFLEYRVVEAGKFCQLLPINKDWIEVENAKRTLEKCLVNYQVLTEGDTIALNFADYGIMKFTVLQVDTDKDYIYIVDTDLSVDLKPALNIDEDDKKEFKIIKEVDKTTGEEIIYPKRFGFFTENFLK